MKLSLSWIRDYVKLPKDFDLTKLAYDLTMSTVEVEGAEVLAKSFDKIIIGEIKAVNPHPNADKLRVCSVNIGEEVKDIVCGGSNLEVGMKVAVACPGAIVRWHGEGEPVEIKNAKLRGVESFGMICAASEIGLTDLFPAHDDHEIVDLTSFDAPAGTPIATALDIDDIILEIDNKSMTNRPDLWGHYGIARELAALYDLPLEPIEEFAAPDVKEFNIEIQDEALCNRYIGVEMSGLSVKEAPYKMRSRIWRVGMRPINALVDITNYVMLATGQPTHAFDADNISDKITVRRAADKEKLLLLNGKDLTLASDDLVISDSEGAVALAGVMGGAKDSILSTTERVILEVANFDSRSIRKTALRYDNRTEASSRYEKAVDAARCDLALSLSMKYFSELYPEMKVTAFKDLYPVKAKNEKIDVSLDWLVSRLGKRIPNEEIERKLGSLGFEVAFEGDTMHLTVPTWRSTGDVSITADIMEEVARMFGYENFEPTPITTSFEGAINQIDKDLVRKIKEYLAFRCEMQEVFTYPWMKDQYVNAILKDTDGVLALSTPPSPDEKYIRSTLLPNICEAVAKNERYFDEFSIFEEAEVFNGNKYSTPYDECEKLPEQKRMISGAFVGNAKNLTNLFRRSKGIIEAMPRYTHMEAYSFEKIEKPYWADETVWMNITLCGKIIGTFGLLSKKTSIACGIKNVAVILFELDTTELRPFTSRTNTFTHLPEYPMVDYDISMLLESSVTWNDLEKVLSGLIKKSAVLHGASFIDEYRGNQVPTGKKSVTVRLSIGSLEKTLTSEEIEACATSVLKSLKATVGAEIRLK